MRHPLLVWTRSLLALATVSLFAGCAGMTLPGLVASADPVRPQQPEIAFAEATRLLDDATIEELRIQAREEILDAVRNTGRVAGGAEGPDDTSCFFEDDTLHYNYRYFDPPGSQALATRKVKIEMPKARVLWVKPNTIGNWRFGLIVEADGEEHEYTLNNLAQTGRVIDAFEILGAEIVYSGPDRSAAGPGGAEPIRRERRHDPTRAVRHQ